MFVLESAGRALQSEKHSWHRHRNLDVTGAYGVVLSCPLCSACLSACLDTERKSLTLHTLTPTLFFIRSTSGPARSDGAASSRVRSARVSALGLGLCRALRVMLGVHCGALLAPFSPCLSFSCDFSFACANKVCASVQVCVRACACVRTCVRGRAFARVCVCAFLCCHPGALT